MIDIRWAPLARNDLERIDRYHRATDQAVADRIGQKMLAATTFLRDMPLAGPIATRGDRRKRNIARTPYILFYRTADTHVRILRVLRATTDQRVK